MTYTDKRYESYRLAWMHDNEIFLDKALRDAVAVAVRLNQAVTVLSAMGIEPGDVGNPAPSNLGAALWHMDTCAQEIVLSILSPTLAGLDPDEAKDAVDRAICDVADARLKVDDNGTDDEIMAAFAETLSAILETGMPGIGELTGQVVDFMEDGIRESMGLDEQADAVLAGGAYDAIRDAVATEIRKHVGGNPDVDPARLADSVLHAMHVACREYGIWSEDVPHPHDTGSYLRETFSNWAPHMAGWKNAAAAEPESDGGTRSERPERLESTDVPVKPQDTRD